MPRPRRLAAHRRRRRWRAADARAVLSELEGSGLSAAAFAVREGFNPQRLYRWRRRLGARSSRAERAPAFVELRPRGGEQVEIVLRSGRLLRVCDTIEPSVLERLVLALERSEPC
jgi:transposase-like protein